MMTLNASTQELIEIAKQRADEDTEHSYTQVENFEPHTWVWLALRDAYNRGCTDTVANLTSREVKGDEKPVAWMQNGDLERLASSGEESAFATDNGYSDFVPLYARQPAQESKSCAKPVAFRINGRLGPYSWFDASVMDRDGEPENHLAEGDWVEYAYAHPAAQEAAKPFVPDGWVLVPVEPSEAMYLAYQEEMCHWSAMTYVDDDVVHALWKTMIAAVQEGTP